MGLLKIRLGNGTYRLVKYEAPPAQYKRVKYLQATDSNSLILMNYESPIFTSTDIFKMDIYIKNLVDRSGEPFIMTSAVNGTGSIALEFRLWTAYYPGQCEYNFSGYKNLHCAQIYRYDEQNPIPRKQELLINGQAVYINDTIFTENMSRDQINVGSLRLLRDCIDAAIGKFEVYDSNMTLKEKLVPCLNKNTGNYGMYSMKSNTFYAGSGTISEFIPPSE